MLIWRRVVLPLLLVLVLGVIAVSLGKLAFFSSPSGGTEEPSAGIANPIVMVERGSVANELNLSGQIARDANVSIRSTVDGTVTAVHVRSGQDVASGAALFTVQRMDNNRKVDIVVAEAGRLGQIELVAGQSVSLGSEVTTLSPARYHVLATVEPVQLYRLIGAPSEATVTISGGPAPFACTALTSQVSDDGTTSVRCSVPGDQTVFPGLPAQLAIAIGTAEDVLVIPTTAVKGGSGSGLVWVDGGDGEPVERQVKLGINDGSYVEVLEGLEEGEQIRQFVPGEAAPVEEFCYEIAPGEEYCEVGVSW